MITSGSLTGQQMLSQASPAPMTPMTPHSADPGILPQLQWVHVNIISSCVGMFAGLIIQIYDCRNIVSTVNLNCKLDLKKIALHARNAEYNPKRFAAVIMRIREPRTTALIFSSGKMVCTGAKSEEDSRLAARKYARIIQKLGFTVSSKTLQLHLQFRLFNILTAPRYPLGLHPSNIFV